MKLGVSGASGKLGAAIVQALAARAGAHEVIAISRSPENVTGAREARRGDFDDPATLVEAYRGLDRVALIPSADLRPGVRGTQLQGAIDAALKAGVGHIFLVSASGTREAHEPAIGASYWRGEQHLMKAARQWTIIRMNYYAEAMAEEIAGAHGQGVLAGLGDERVAYVSRDDVAAAVAGALTSEGHAGAIYNATGPAIVTGEERAAIAAQILGKPLGFAAISPDQLRAGLAQAGLPQMIVDVIIDIKTNFVQGHFDVLTSDVARLSGAAPKSFRDVLASMIA